MQEIRVTLPDGADTTLTLWGEEGPLVLAIHGITSSRLAWRRLAEDVAGRLRIAAYDQRGHGDAYKVEGPMTLVQSVADAEAVLAALGEPVAGVLGHSWGGAVALLLGERTKALSVLAVDPMLYVEPGSWEREFLDDVQSDLALDQEARARLLRERLKTWHPLDVEGKVHAMAHMSPTPIERLGRENRVDEGGWDLRALVAAYPHRLLLLVAGPEDSVIRPEDLAALRRAGNPRIEIQEFPEEGHNLHRTAFPAFRDAVLRFFVGG
jgi:pimeloyl-ACP methyl ester carboxylesterase